MGRSSVAKRAASRILVAVGVVAAAAAASPATASARGSALPTWHPVGASHAKFTELGGGAPVLSTANTVTHWHGTFLDPHNGVTYGFNMVGTDPAGESSATISTVMVPINLVFAGQGGYPLNGTDVAPALAGSPIWVPSDYSQSGDTNVQYGDAVMRAQFNKVGTGYHVRLGSPAMHAPVTFRVPAGQGFAAQITNGPVVGVVNSDWFASVITQLDNTLGLDPRTLPVYVTDNVILYVQNNLNACCVIGFHGASEVNGHGTGSTHGNGNQKVQTFAWSSYLRPGVFSTTDSPDDLTGAHFLQDIHPISHEISEWMDDPFVNNKVEPWLTPTAPQYGCTGVLETGDPVVGIGFHHGTNTFAQDTANGADGFWHPEDEVFLSWFARETPSRALDGNYTFMGPDNPFPGFHMPATGC
jgi:hypothetical protein